MMNICNRPDIRRGCAVAMILAGLVWLTGGCAVTAPLADEEPATDDRRGGASSSGDEDAGALLREQLGRADTALASIDAYEAELVKEERIDGRLFQAQRLACKVRHEPFAVYLRFLAPDELVGQEALYAGARYEGKLIARAAGLAGRLGAVALDPVGQLAMRGNRYPITDTGMLQLLAKVLGLVGDGEGLEQLTVLEGASVDGRPCTLFEAVPCPGADFALARIYFDEEWDIPVSYEVFENSDEGLRLLERYTYVSVRLGAVLSDDDFDRGNPEYELR